jgi:hypothetical protein
MFIINYILCISNKHLSLPAGREAMFGAPSPLGEGWDGGPQLLKIIVLFMIPGSHFVIL